MKKLENYHKIAILFNETNYEISLNDIVDYLNAGYDFYHENPTNTNDRQKYLIEETGLSKKTIKRLEEASKEIIAISLEEKEGYPLAKQYALISNVIGEMEDSSWFVEGNFEDYKAAIEFFNEIGEKIIENCQISMSEEYQDLMSDGKITEDNYDSAIRRYMKNHGYKPNEERVIN